MRNFFGVSLSISCILLGLGCKPAPERLANYAKNEPEKYSYCTHGQKYMAFISHTPPDPLSINDERAKKYINCIRQVSKTDLEEHRQRLFLQHQQEQEAYEETKRKEKEKKNAQETLDLIEAKIKVEPEKHTLLSRKVRYCKTKPQFRQHGVLIANELAKSSTETIARKTNRPLYLEPVALLNCIDQTSDKTIANFFNALDIKIQKEKEAQDETMRNLELKFEK